MTLMKDFLLHKLKYTKLVGPPNTENNKVQNLNYQQDTIRLSKMHLYRNIVLLLSIETRYWTILNSC